MFENVDGRTDGRTTDGRTTDGRTTDTGVTGILIAHLGAFGSGELKNVVKVGPLWQNFLDPRMIPEQGFSDTQILCHRRISSLLFIL